MKLGVITDGISRDLPYALNVMDEFGLTHAELQFVGTSEVGDHTAHRVIGIGSAAGTDCEEFQILCLRNAGKCANGNRGCGRKAQQF